MKICSESDCERTDLSGRGLCSRHYQLYRYRGTLDEVAPPIRTCQICGDPIIGKDWRAKYCSRECNERARALREAEARAAAAGECERCGKSLVGKRSHAKFCSEKCGSDQHNADMAAQRLANKKPCDHCGMPLPLQRKRFCSDECKMAHRRPETYGLTRDELEALLAQHDVCAICGTDQWGRKGPQIDHCHDSGRIRGVLCTNCNTMLGHAHDDPGMLRKAADYLDG